MMDYKKFLNKKTILPGILVLVVLLVILLVFFLNDKTKSRANDDADKSPIIIEGERIEENTVSVSENESGSKVDSVMNEISIPSKEIDWDELKNTNTDVYAWVYVPGTDVDYPVLQHPTDDSYYLNHTIEGKKGLPGCIMTELYNKKDFSDPLTVIYGHNMRSGEMFASLHMFEDAKEFDGEHYIYVYTENESFAYKIFAAREYTAQHLLANYDYTEEGIFKSFIDSVFTSGCRVGNINNEIEVQEKDRVLALSTCTKDSRDDLRFITFGVLVLEEEN
ncbi:MAG: class B sortase [Acetatifactor sp.]|nr:class B sortase [Acetatifactor sp.]